MKGLAFIGALAPLLAFAAPPTIRHEGRLLEANGEPVEGEITVHAALYAEAEGGDPLWEESYTVQVEKGLLRLVLGTPADGKLTLAGVDLPARAWISLRIGDDAEMAPRLPLYDAPFALYAHALASGAPGSGTVRKLTAGTGLTGGEITTDGTFSLDFETGGSATTASRGDHTHDASYLRASTLAATGGSGTVDWTQLKSVPAGLADGLDNVGSGAFTEGVGMAVDGATLSVDLPATSVSAGSSNQVARADHTHDILYVRPDAARSISGLKTFTGTTPFAVGAGAPLIAGLDADRIGGLDLAGLASGSLDCAGGQAVTGFETVSGQLRPKCSPVAPPTADACSDPTTLLYMKFDEASGTTAADCSANDYDFTAQGSSVTWVPGVKGNAVKLASNSFLKIGAASKLDIQNWNAIMGFAYDASRQRVVLYGGRTANETWEWDGSTWAKNNGTQPPSRFAQDGTIMAYHAARGRIVLFGGQTGGTALDDTWEYNGSNWTQVTVPAADKPQGRYSHLVVYHDARMQMLLFNGAGVVETQRYWTYGPPDTSTTLQVVPDGLASCKAILESFPAAASGTYTIDPDGSGSGAPFRVFCDMATDGGGWTLVARGVAPASSNWLTTSDLNLAESTGIGGTFKFADTTINAIPKTRYRYKGAGLITEDFFWSGACVYAHTSPADGACNKSYPTSDLTTGSLQGSPNSAHLGMGDWPAGTCLHTSHSQDYWYIRNGTGCANGTCNGKTSNCNVTLWVK